MKPQEYIRTIATHYPDSDSIHRILEYASVDIINLDIEGKPLNTWFMALKEVVIQNKLPEFITTVSAEYPTLKISDIEQNELKKFLAKKQNAPGERNDNFKNSNTVIFILGILLIPIVGIIIFNSIQKNKPKVNHPLVVEKIDSAIYTLPVAVEKDSTSDDSVQFVIIRHKDKPFDFPAHKNFLQLKQYILASKEGLRDFDAANSELTYLGKKLADNLKVSNIYWEDNKNVELKITRDSTRSTPHVEIFLQNKSLHDIMIFIEDQAGYIMELHNDRTRIWVPKYLGDHNLEIYFKDSLAILPLHMEYSTANIFIRAEDFNKNSRRIKRVKVR